MVLKWLVVLQLCCFVTSVDRGNFKTCDNSGFCKRQRNYNPEESPYRALLDSIKTSDGQVNLELLNTRSHVRLLLSFAALKENTARLRITEADPAKPRYEPPVGDVLRHEPQKDKLDISSKSTTSVTLSFNGNQVVIQSQPFRIDFVVDGEPVISVNSRGLLKFEHTRVKNEPGMLGRVYSWVTKPFRAPEGGAGEPQDNNNEQQGDQNQNPEPPEDETDMWEETFKSHKDTKPNGPQSVGMDISFPGFEHVYGIPEHADSFALKSTKNTDPYRLYNLDVFEYELDNPMALYGSVPVMYAHNEKKTVGMFWLNAAETWIDISSKIADKSTFTKLVDFVKGDNSFPETDTHWFSESGIIDVFFMLGPKPADAFKQYAKLTGTTPLPPLFALAYHQSRWNYNDEQDVAGVDANFDEHDIPCDVIWLDIEHTDGKRYFTWDKSRFPNSGEMLRNVSGKGRKMVNAIDPHIKRDKFDLYNEAKNLGYLVKDKSGNDYDGFCWPGSSGWLDFVDPKVRDYWAKKFSLDQYKGSTLDLYTWNDMNEPSVFNGPEITMHKDAKHFGDWEHRDVHNIYGMYVHQATFEGQLQRANNERRPFVLSRAFYAGTQNYGAIWTGDNTGEWGHLKATVPMVLSVNIVGVTMSGADVGGFFKNPDNELLTRWYQAGAYQPFFRAHAHLDTRRREPWVLPESNKLIIRDAIRARYALLPYWYTLFYESELSGEPVMKPLWVDFPEEKETFAVDDEHLVGPGLLVKPVTDQGATGVNVYLPGKDKVWYDVDTFTAFAGNQKLYQPVDLAKIPVYQLGGTIIPRKERIRRASSLSYEDPYTLTVALDQQGKSFGQLYMDDYDGFQYQKGHFAFRKFVFENNKLTNKNIHPSDVGFQTKSWLERVTVVGIGVKPKLIQVSGQGFEKKKLEFTYSASTKLLVIRKPGVNINIDWVIEIQ